MEEVNLKSYHFLIILNKIHSIQTTFSFIFSDKLKKESVGRRLALVKLFV